MLSEQDIAEFREIYRRELGEEISISEAAKQAGKLLSFVSIGRKILSEKQWDEVQESWRSLKDVIVTRLEDDPNWHRK
tara:strand:- start:199 stop:432 length:234 start_codon:yes stop_codon:yes gene_type:complete